LKEENCLFDYVAHFLTGQKFLDNDSFEIL
jgi:hypothetical protein